MRRPQDAAAFLAELEDAATRRYGADWLTRASIAGLVAAPGTTVGVMATAGGTHALAQQADPPVFTAETNQAPATRRRFQTRTKVAGGTGAVIALGAVVIVAVAATGTSKSSAEPAGSAPGPPSHSTATIATPTARPPALAAASSKLVGRYRVVRTLSRLSYGGPIGKPSPVTWTISRGCTQSPCSMAIASSTGQTYRASFDGIALSISIAAGTDSGPCCDASGASIPGARVNESDSGFAVKFAIVYRNGDPSAFSGRGVFKVNQSVIGNCTAHSGTIRERFTATRL